MTREPSGFGSFGRPDREPVTRDEPEQLPVPVLHVGEVHADLVLHITDRTLTDLGSQIASMIARATKAGFEHGLNQAMGEPEGSPSDLPPQGG
jgi:hypothetical protein